MGASVFHFICVYLFINVMEWGFTGICVATSLQFVIRQVICVIQINTTPALKNTYGVKLFSRESTIQVGYQFNLGIMGMLMGVWGWWAFDIFTLMASYLSVTIVSAQTIMRSLGLMTYMIPVGFSTACGILVGKSIGCGSIAQVKFYYKICM
jgi:MATE family multidrug resistance protein